MNSTYSAIVTRAETALQGNDFQATKGLQKTVTFLEALLQEMFPKALLSSFIALAQALRQIVVWFGDYTFGKNKVEVG